MTAFTRTDTSLLGRWWWTVDRWTLAAVVMLAAIGAILALAASPAVAERIGLDTFYFARRQMAFLAVGLAVLLAVSFLSRKGVRRFAVLLTFAAMAVMALTLVFGTEIKGAVRWIRIGGVSIQASEFVKPGFAVFAAWLFAAQRLDDRVPGFAWASLLYGAIVGLLLLQPDVGMALVVSAIWGVEFFVAGLPLIFVIAIALLIIAGGVGAYFSFDHVRSRVDRFFDPQAGEGFQVSQAMEAFRNGGWAGRGPGEGRVKEILPDAHADFIFAVAGEEFGLIACLAVVLLFVFIVLRGIGRILKDEDLFALIAVTGLTVQFAIQAIINLASTLNLMPPKGMTLPFISYGGSSMLALGCCVGMILALTRSRPGIGGAP